MAKKETVEKKSLFYESRSGHIVSFIKELNDVQPEGIKIEKIQRAGSEIRAIISGYTEPAEYPITFELVQDMKTLNSLCNFQDFKLEFLEFNSPEILAIVSYIK